MIFQCSQCQKEIHRQPAYIARSKTGKFFCGKPCEGLNRRKLTHATRLLQMKTYHGLRKQRKETGHVDNMRSLREPIGQEAGRSQQSK